MGYSVSLLLLLQRAASALLLALLCLAPLRLPSQDDSSARSSSLVAAAASSWSESEPGGAARTTKADEGQFWETEQKCQLNEMGECIVVPPSSSSNDDEPPTTSNNKGTLAKNETQFVFKAGSSILDYLNPEIFGNPEIMAKIRHELRAHHVVVIRDAFQEDFAEYVWRDLSRDDLEWPMNEDYSPDGFSFRHHNFYEMVNYTRVMNETNSIFNHPAAKRWIGELTGRDVSEEFTLGAPSRYFPGDYSNPHADYYGMRTVAFVWHLSRNWDPAWGGALYWCAEPDGHHAYSPATFNTLNLFSVTKHTNHFVTIVSPHAKEKRLTFNGWWEAGSYPTVDDDLFEKYDTVEKRLHLAADQVEEAKDLDMSEIEDDVRRAKMEGWQETLWKEYDGESSHTYVVDVHGRYKEEEEEYYKDDYDEEDEDEEDYDDDEAWDYEAEE